MEGEKKFQSGGVEIPLSGHDICIARCKLLDMCPRNLLPAFDFSISQRKWADLGRSDEERRRSGSLGCLGNPKECGFAEDWPIVQEARRAVAAQNDGVGVLSTMA